MKRDWEIFASDRIVRARHCQQLVLVLQTKSIGASVELTILIYAGFNLVAALISYPAGSLSDQWGRRNMLLLSFFIFFFSYLWFVGARSVHVIGPLFAFYGSFQGIFRSVGKGFASDFVPEHLPTSGLAGTARLSVYCSSWQVLLCSGT